MTIIRGLGRNGEILIVSGSMLDEFELQPGALFENVTVDGLDVMQLVQGHRVISPGFVRVGDSMRLFHSMRP